jgi:Right handed beta helix region
MRNFTPYALAAMLALAILSFASPSRASTATAVSACGTLSPAGNYFLTKDLTSTGTCIVIGDEGVALDMKGHTIRGNGTGDGISDGGSTFQSMAIANGKIRNFSVGVALDNSCCVVIRNVDSSKNTDAGVLIGRCCGVLDSVVADNNGNTGIFAEGCCYSLNNIEADSNGGGGGIVTTGCCSTVANSTVSRNIGTGVTQTGCCNFVVSSNVNDSNGDGVDMSGCCNFMINSRSSSNEGAGVSLTGSDNLVIGATVVNNGLDGIDLATNGNQITNTQSLKNGGVGASVGCPGAIAGFTAHGNTGGSLTTTGGTCTELNNTL